MSSIPPQNSPNDGRGLPPVTPPSFGFLAQLFVVPFLIVLVAVFLWLIFRTVTYAGNSPESILRNLDSANADIRWRRASDLAQILKRPEAESMKLKTNVWFAMELVERVHLAINDLELSEKELARDLAARQASMQPKEIDIAWRRLSSQRDNIRFLAAALGDFVVPVGTPVLARLASRDDSPDVKNNTLIRRQAVWTLGLMGESRKAFEKLPDAQKAEIVDGLKKELAKEGIRKDAARSALFYVNPGGLGTETFENITKVDAVLSKCARDPDQFLRMQVALACNFWEGDDVEATLVRLSRDDGFGTLLRVSEDE